MNRECSLIHRHLPRLAVAITLCAGLLVLPASQPVTAADLHAQRVAFQRAETALRLGQRAAFEREAATLYTYPLYPFLFFRKMERGWASEAEIAGFLASYPASRDRDRVHTAQALRLARQGRWMEFSRLVDTEPKDERLRCRFHQFQWLRGEMAAAFAGARRLWHSGRTRAADCDALFEAWRASTRFTADDLWTRLGLALDAGNHGLVQYLIRLAPDRKAALAWREVHRQPERVTRCEPWTRDSALRGRILAHGIRRLARTDPDLAAAVWQGRRSQMPIAAADRVETALQLATAFAVRHRDEARRWIAEVPPERHTPESRALAVRIALRAGDPRGVLDAVASMPARERALPRWRYWRARAMETLGQDRAALDEFNQLARSLDFYGLLAAVRVGDGVAAAASTPRDEAARGRQLARLAQAQAVREFLYLGRRAEARAEWHALVERVPELERPALAWLALQWEQPALAIHALRKADAAIGTALQFPLAWASAIYRQAAAQNVQPAWLFGLVRRESAFDVMARSPAGALGLSQLMPDTGRYVAGRLGEDLKALELLYDPERNLRYGTYYLRLLLDRFDGSLALAAAGYNAGPGRAERWRPENTAMALDIWAETIPYKETREYVAWVLTYAMIYSRRLQEDPARLLAQLKAEIAPGKTQAVAGTVRWPGCNGGTDAARLR